MGCVFCLDICLHNQFVILTHFHSFSNILKKKNTVFSPINGHSKRQTLLISGQLFFHQPNSGQSLIKNFLKGEQVINGHYFLHEIVDLAFFSLQLADSPKFLDARIKKKK